MTNLNKKKFFKVNNFVIGGKGRTFIIAEIGINHEGSLERCKRLIKSASKAGADGVKIQTVNVNESYEKNSKSYKEFKDKNFSDKQIKELIRFSKKLKLIFFSTPGDISSLKRLCALKVPIIKISSGLSNNFPLIRETLKNKKPIIISTGFSDYQDLKELKNYLKKFKFKKIAILKCTSKYPLLNDEVNMSNLIKYKELFDYPIGYSDHTKDTLTPLIAVANGASIIEKHFTLYKKRNGADHHFSLEPKEFSLMVKNIRTTEKIIGSEEIKLLKEVKKNKKNSQRVLMAKRKILKGDKFSLKNIQFMRTQKKGGKPSKFFLKFENKRSKKKYFINDII